MYDLRSSISKKMFKNSSILGYWKMGSFGHSFILMTLEKYNPKKR